MPVAVESYSKTSVRPARPFVGDLSKPAGASGNARTSSGASTTGRPKLARARSGETCSGFSCASADMVKNTSKLVVTVLVNAPLRSEERRVGEEGRDRR